VSAKRSGPGPQQKRFAAYLDNLAPAAGHADRIQPLKSYCTGLLLPGERKSVEPMAARLAPGNVRRLHQSLHHLVADSPWSDQALLSRVRSRVLPAMERHGPVAAWIVNDTAFPKKGRHSVGVARQYGGPLGKQENCRVAVSLSVATWNSSLPIAYGLYLPATWAQDKKRRRKAGVPEEVGFQTKPQIALDQIRRAREQEVEPGVVLADAAYGKDSAFRAGLSELALRYVVGVQSSTTVWEPGAAPLPAKPWKGQGRPPRLLRRDPRHQPISLEQLARALPAAAWKTIVWRQGSQRRLRSRFAAVRVRPAHRDYGQAEAHAEEWLLIEWPPRESAASHYWLSTLPPETPLKALVKMAKHRWIIERDYEEFKQELGLGHYEGRGWRGFHHHATLCIAAYGFLIAERNCFSPSARVGQLALPAPRRSPPASGRAARRVRPERHNPHSIATGC